MFFIGRFVIAWSLWFLIADKKRWAELLPISMLAALLGSTTDNIITHYELWKYYDESLPELALKIMDDWGIYIVVTYLFIQFLPKKQSFFNMVKYIFLWTLLSVVIEWIHLYTGHMKHDKFWNLRISYICDWILYALFYFYYKLHSRHLVNYQTKNLANLADIVIFLDKKGTLIQCFSEWFKTIKYNPNNDIGKTFDKIDGLKNTDIHTKAFERVLKGENTIFTFDWKSPKGRIYSFENSLSPILDNRNEMIGIIGIINLIPKKP